MSGKNYTNVAVGFATVNATASSGNDQATLSDAALAGLFTGGGTTGRLSGTVYKININQFDTVKIIGGSKKNTIHLNGNPGYKLTKQGTWITT